MPKSPTQRRTSGRASPVSHPYGAAYNFVEGECSSPTSPSTSKTSKARCQNSACEPCRVRRVKCDRKDKDHSSPDAPPVCTNCKDRDFACVLNSDRPEEPKPRLLRRGRRIQKVEAMFGLHSLAKKEEDTIRSENIPALQSSFFRSKFWRWFCLQHPILDSAEIVARCNAHESGDIPLSKEGQLLMMAIVVWAASYGVNEKGAPLRCNKGLKGAKLVAGTPPPPRDFDSLSVPFATNPELKAHVNTMLTELIDYIDLSGLSRVPTWDGVRVLFLLHPLLREETNPGSSFLQTQTMLGLSFSQGRVLTTLTLPAPPDSAVRKSIFWYFYLEDSLGAGLEGRRLTFSEDDVIAFQDNEAKESSSTSLKGMLPRPASAQERVGFSTRPSQDNQFFVIPMDIGDLCRTMHKALSSPLAMKRPVNLKAINHLWFTFDSLWQRLEALQGNGIPVHDEQMDIEKFVATWKLVIFRCHIRIRDDLFNRLTLEGNASIDYVNALRDSHSTAANQCRRHLPNVVEIIKQQLSYEKAPIFRYDFNLVEDAVYNAALLVIDEAFEQMAPTAAGFDDFKQMALDSEGSIRTCVRALENTEWIFSKRRSKIDHLDQIWKARISSVFYRNGDIPPHTQIYPTPGASLHPPASNFFGHPPSGIDGVSDQTSLRQTPPEAFEDALITQALQQPQQPSSFLFTATRPTTGHSEPGQCHVLTSGHKWSSYTPEASHPPPPHPPASGKEARPSLPPINVNSYMTFAYSAPNTALSTESPIDQWTYSPPSTGASSSTLPIESPITPYGNDLDRSIMINHHHQQHSHSSASSPTNDFSGVHGFEDYSKLTAPHPSPVVYDGEPPAYDAAFFSQDGFSMSHGAGNYQLETVHPPQVPPMHFIPPPN